MRRIVPLALPLQEIIGNMIYPSILPEHQGKRNLETDYRGDPHYLSPRIESWWWSLQVQSRDHSLTCAGATSRLTLPHWDRPLVRRFQKQSLGFLALLVYVLLPECMLRITEHHNKNNTIGNNYPNIVLGDAGGFLFSRYDRFIDPNLRRLPLAIWASY